MGMGHQKIKQISFFGTNWKHQLLHGGTLRKKKLGRGQRPLSTKEPIHVVFKVISLRLRHKSLRSSQSFDTPKNPKTAFKDIKTTMKAIKENTKNIWKYRPFTSVVRSWKAYQLSEIIFSSMKKKH